MSGLHLARRVVRWGGLEWRAAVRARSRAAVLGAFVADAATMPLHWIYDVQRIEQLVGDAAPTFFQPPSCPYYDVRYTAGMWSRLPPLRLHKHHRPLPRRLQARMRRRPAAVWRPIGVTVAWLTRNSGMGGLRGRHSTRWASSRRTETRCCRCCGASWSTEGWIQTL